MTCRNVSRTSQRTHHIFVTHFYADSLLFLHAIHKQWRNYWHDYRFQITERTRDFSIIQNRPDRLWGQSNIFCKQLSYVPGVKRPERVFYHSPLHRVEVKTERNCTSMSTTTHALSAWTGTSFTTITTTTATTITTINNDKSNNGMIMIIHHSDFCCIILPRHTLEKHRLITLISFFYLFSLRKVRPYLHRLFWPFFLVALVCQYIHR